MTVCRIVSPPVNRVVHVKCALTGTTLGSAFPLGRTHFLYTVNHVVELFQAKDLLVDCGGRKQIRANVASTDPKSGLAVIKADTLLWGIPKVYRKARIGEPVYVCGFPKTENSQLDKGPVCPRVCVSNIMAEIGSGSNRRLELYGSFPRGFSGAPVTAMADGKLLGLLDSLGFSTIDEVTGVGFHLGLAIPVESCIYVFRYHHSSVPVVS